MGIVVELFGAGKMFLPHIIKSARVMRKAPFMEEAPQARMAAGREVVSTHSFSLELRNSSSINVNFL